MLSVSILFQKNKSIINNCSHSVYVLKYFVKTIILSNFISGIPKLEAILHPEGKYHLYANTYIQCRNLTHTQIYPGGLHEKTSTRHWSITHSFFTSNRVFV